jgi:hypothetical protein
LAATTIPVPVVAKSIDARGRWTVKQAMKWCFTASPLTSYKQAHKRVWVEGYFLQQLSEGPAPKVKSGMGILFERRVPAMAAYTSRSDVPALGVRWSGHNESWIPIQWAYLHGNLDAFSCTLHVDRWKHWPRR